MATIVSTVHTDSEAFSENRERMLGFVDQLRRYEQRTEETSNRRLKTFRARNQLTPKERLDALIDPGMPFLQLHSMANFCVEESDREVSVPGASVIVGIGFE